MDKLGKIRRHHWKKRLKISKDELPNLKVICSKLMKILQLLKVAKFYSRFYGGGTNLPPTIKTSVKFRNFTES